MEAPRDFVERYRAAWEQVMSGNASIESMTPFFHTPYIMIGAEGALSQFATPQEISSFNQSRLEVFRAGGAEKARLRGCDVTTLGAHCALAVVNWELSRADNSIERAWRHYYNLLHTKDGWKIVLSAFQTGS
jgi:hypothetical protein